MLRDLRQLAVRDEGIERQVDPHAAHMAVAHRLRQLVQCEIARTCAGIEPLRAQIDRIGTVADGGVQRIKGPGGESSSSMVETPFINIPASAGRKV